MTTEEFIAKSKQIHGEIYNYTKTKYFDQNTKLTLICLLHGEFEQSPKMHYKSKGCSKCIKEKASKEFIERAKKIHGDTYIYNKTVYTGMHNKVTITCPIHGDFEQRAFAHLKPQHCPACGKIGTLAGREKVKKSTKDFIKEARLVHGNKYDYSITDYITAKKDLFINCPNHGEFRQRPGNHLNGQGCTQCSRRGYSDTEWANLAIKSNYFTGFKLYIIECWDKSEKFIKVGKTFTEVGKRFRNKSDMPYEWTLIKVIEGSAKYISELERTLLKQNNKYIPKVPFSGQTECFAITAKEPLLALLE